MPPPWIHKPKKPYYSNSSSIGNNANSTNGPSGNSNNSNVGFRNSPTGGITSSGNHYRPSPTNIEEGEISSPRYSNNSGSGGPLYSSRKFFPPNSNRSLNRGGSNISGSVNNNGTSTVSNSNNNNNVVGGGISSSSHHHEDGEISTSPTNGTLSYQGGGDRGKSHYNRSYNNFNRRNYHNNDFHRSNSNSSGGGGGSGGININNGPSGGDRFPNTSNPNSSAPPNISGVGNPTNNTLASSSLINNNNNNSSSSSGVPSLPVGSYAALSETASSGISNTSSSTLTQKWEPPPTTTTSGEGNMLLYDWRKTKATTIAISSEKSTSKLDNANPNSTANTAGPFSAAPPPSYHDSNNNFGDSSSSLNSNTNQINHSKWEQPSSSYNNRNNRFDRETYYGSRKHFRGRSLGNDANNNNDLNSVGGDSSLNNNSNTNNNAINSRDPRNNFSSFRKNNSDRSFNNKWENRWSSSSNSANNSSHPQQGQGQTNDSSSTQSVESNSNNYYGPSSSPMPTSQSGNQNDRGYRKGGGGVTGGSYNDDTTESPSQQQQVPTPRKKFNPFGYNSHHNSTMPRFKPPPGVKQNVFTPPTPGNNNSNTVSSLEDREQFQQQSQHRNNFKTSTYIIGGGKNTLESSNSSDLHPSHRDVRRTPSFNTDEGNHPLSSQSNTLNNDDTTTSHQYLKPSSSNDANQDIDSKKSMDQSEQDDKDEKNQRPLSPLTVASLGNKDNAAKAAKVIRRLSSLNSLAEDGEELMNESLDSVILPSTEEIHSGLSELELKIKERQDESAQIRADLKRIKEMEEKRLQQSMTDEPKDSVDIDDDDQMEEEEKVENPGVSNDTKVDNHVNIEKQELIVVDADTRKQERKEIEVELTLIMNSLKGLVENRTKKEDEMKESIDKTYEVELAQITADYHNLCKENSNLIDNASLELDGLQTFLKELESNSKSIGKSIDDIDCDIAEEERKKTKLLPIPEEKLIDASEVVLQKKLGVELSDSMKSILHCCKDSKEEMNNFVITILSENHIRVKQSHHEALHAIPFDPECSTSSSLHSNGSLPGLIAEPYAIDEDERRNESFQKWSNMARTVSGPGDALYTEPSETLLYDDIEKNHEEMKLLVREHVRAKRRKLSKYWTDLAHEYMFRKTRYNKDNQGDASKSSVDPVSGPISILGKRKENPTENSGSVEIGGIKGNSNPYRRPRRGEASTSGFGTSDIVRTEYEQEQIIAQLTANDAMEKRIKLGGSKLPRQRCHLEKNLFVSYHDRFSHRYVEDFLHEENERRYVNPWSDVEKCIFFDKFLQHPKDFKKIASFLRNKTTHDCISFYYDSKQTVPYKAALKEYIARTKKRGEVTSWDATVQAALSIGASISDGSSPEKPLVFSLPKNDNTYNTIYMHPLSANLLDNIETEDIVEDPATEFVNKLSPSKSKQACRTLFSYERRFVKSKPLNILQKDTNSSDGEITNPIEKSFSSSENIAETVTPSDVVKQISSKKDVEKPTSSKIAAKWSKEEKLIFSKTFEQHGKNWQLIAESLATKTIPQIKSYYQENKKQFSKKRLGNTSAKELKTIKLENSQEIEAHVTGQFKENSSRPPIVVKQQDDDSMQIERHLNIVQELQPESLNQSLQSRIEGGQPIDYSFLQNSDQQWSQRQLEWVLEQHRHRLSEQQIQQLNQQRQLELAQYQQQQILHQQQHSQHLQNLLARNHLDFLHASGGHNQHGLSNLQMTSWLTAQHMNLRASLQRQQQQQQEGHIRDWGLEDENSRIQNTIAAVRQAAQRQHNGYNLGMGSLTGMNHNHNDGSSNNNNNNNNRVQQHQGVSYNNIGRGDLDLLVRMAADASRNNNSQR